MSGEGASEILAAVRADHCEDSLAAAGMSDADELLDSGN